MSWSAADWITRFTTASCARDGRALRALRRQVYETTVAAVRDRSYASGEAKVALAFGDFEAMREGTTFHADSRTLSLPEAPPGSRPTRVTVHNADFLEVARAIATPGEVPAVLNMANPFHPGGGVEHGAGAQEENLFRRSNLLYALYSFSDELAAAYGVPPHAGGLRYPLPEPAGGIFTPGVQVFRSTEATGYAFLPRPYPVNVLTVAAIPDPDLEERDGRPWLTREAEELTLIKIWTILRVAAHHRQTALVLSAFGCGAFGNPPHHVALLFLQALEEPEFEGAFRHVAFAILDDHNAFRPDSPEGNWLPFQRAFADLGP